MTGFNHLKAQNLAIFIRGADKVVVSHKPGWKMNWSVAKHKKTILLNNNNKKKKEKQIKVQFHTHTHTHKRLKIKVTYGKKV